MTGRLVAEIREKIAEDSFVRFGQNETGKPLRPDSAISFIQSQYMAENDAAIAVYNEKARKYPQLVDFTKPDVDNKKKNAWESVAAAALREKITDDSGNEISFLRPNGDKLR